MNKINIKEKSGAALYDGEYCSIYREYSKRSNSTGKIYNKRDLVGDTQYKYKEGDELNQKGNVIRNVFNAELNKNIKEIYVLGGKNGVVQEELEDKSSEETPEEFLASSICGLVNAIIEIPNAKILNTYYKGNRIYIDWRVGDSEKKRTASNPLKIKTTNV